MNSTNGGNNGNPLRNGIILNLDKRMDEVLKGVGRIQGDIEALRNEGLRRSVDLQKIERKFLDALRKQNRRFSDHLKAHREEVDYMGVLPFLRRYAKRHWRYLVFLFVAGQIVMTLLVFKFGLEKFVKLIFSG